MENERNTMRFRTLGKLVTREFRGYCDEMGSDTVFPELYVHNLNKGKPARSSWA